MQKHLRLKLDHRAHVALVYHHDEGKLITYVNGKRDSELDCIIPRTTFPKGFLGRSNYNSDGPMEGTIDAFHIVDGEALWNSDFAPPVPQ